MILDFGKANINVIQWHKAGLYYPETKRSSEAL